MESQHGPFVEFLKTCAGLTLVGLIGWGITCSRLAMERKDGGHQKTTSELKSEKETELLLKYVNSLLLKDEEEDYKRWCKTMPYSLNDRRYTSEQQKKFRKRHFATVETNSK